MTFHMLDALKPAAPVAFKVLCKTPRRLSPNGGGPPLNELSKAFEVYFGGFGEFKSKFTQKALTNFGSGWTWLVQKDDCSMEIVNTDDAKTPLTEEGVTPLLGCDVWEHAYYIDYRNARPKYMDAFWNLVNWDHVTNHLNS